MGEKVIVASRSVVVTLVICGRGEKKMELVPRSQKPSKTPPFPIAQPYPPPWAQVGPVDQCGCPLRNAIPAPGVQGQSSGCKFEPRERNKPILRAAALITLSLPGREGGREGI